MCIFVSLPKFYQFVCFLRYCIYFLLLNIFSCSIHPAMLLFDILFEQTNIVHIFKFDLHQHNLYNDACYSSSSHSTSFSKNFLLTINPALWSRHCTTLIWWYNLKQLIIKVVAFPMNNELK